MCLPEWAGFKLGTILVGVPGSARSKSFKRISVVAGAGDLSGSLALAGLKILVPTRGFGFQINDSNFVSKVGLLIHVAFCFHQSGWE